MQHCFKIKFKKMYSLSVIRFATVHTLFRMRVAIVNGDNNGNELKTLCTPTINVTF